MFEKLKAFISVFRYGSEVSNVTAWKTGHMVGATVGGLIIALANLAHLFGHDLPIDLATANTIGAGVVAVANVLLVAATSRHAGLLPAAEPAPLPASIPTSIQQVPGIDTETIARGEAYVSGLSGATSASSQDASGV